MSFNIKYMISCIKPIIEKFPITIQMTLLGTVFALLLGIIFAIIDRSQKRILSSFVKVIKSFLKGVPILVYLYLFYYAMDDIMVALGNNIGFEYDLRNPPKILFVVLAFAISYAPYMCDMILSAFDTIPKGQLEACYSMGFTRIQAMIRIVIPQLIVVAIPNFGNHFVNLLKATSLAYMVTIVEMMGAAKNFAVKNQRFLETYIMAALIFWVVFILFEWGFKFLENHCGRYLRVNGFNKKQKAVE